MSNPIDIHHLARLARLSLTPDEEHAAQKDLESIITMIDTMQAVDTSGVTPMANPLEASQRLRSDAVTETIDIDRFQATAPDTEDGYYLVPRVIE
jgi:aspartyl-tRNA(Asn)/glutamyl-tRNA(Gln) amidotransferase subunit C